MATRKQPGTAVANYSEELAKLARIAKKTEDSVSLGSFISVKSGQMSLNGNDFEDNKFQAVVLDHVLENTLYLGDFDPDNPASPVCFAFGVPDEEGDVLDMKPHEKSTQPQGSEEDGTCAGCPQNVFGTADTGKGKACKNSRRLAMISSDSLDDVSKAQVVFMKLPVTSVRPWAACVQTLAKEKGLPPLAFVIEIECVATPRDKAPFKLTFTPVSEVTDNATLGALLAKRKTCAEELVRPYEPFEEAAAPAKKNTKISRPALKPTPAAKKAAGKR